MRILSVPVATPRRMRRSSDRSRPRLVRFAIIDVGFRNTRAPRGPLPSIRLDSFNSAGSLVALDRMKGRESVFARGKRARARARRVHTNGGSLPVHVVLQFHLYWTVPRGLILVVVFILRYLCKHSKKKRRDEDSLLYISRLTDRRNFSWETAPRQVFPPPRCKCNSTRCSLHFT